MEDNGAPSPRSTVSSGARSSPVSTNIMESTAISSGEAPSSPSSRQTVHSLDLQFHSSSSVVVVNSSQSKGESSYSEESISVTGTSQTSAEYRLSIPIPTMQSTPSNLSSPDPDYKEGDRKRERSQESCSTSTSFMSASHSSINIDSGFNSSIRGAAALERVDGTSTVVSSSPPLSDSTPSPSFSTMSKPLNNSKTSSNAPPWSNLSDAGGKTGGESQYAQKFKVDEDIQVGKKIVRRRKLSVARPPSSSHVDVRPPTLTLVQRALRAHRAAAGVRRFRRPSSAAVASEFHNEKGNMLLGGSEEGQYVGDVLGGLPHGYGQHWIRPRCPACGFRTDDLHMLYEGAWEYGTKHGFGRMLYTNGQEYRGHFKGGERHGRGTMRYADGSIFDGEWTEGRKTGVGACYYGDGGIFKGFFSKDNRDGWGIYYSPSKCRKQEGEWVGDDPVCGNATSIPSEEYDRLVDSIPDWCDAKGRLPHPLPLEALPLPLQTLRNPELAYYPHACARRQHRLDLKKEALTAPRDPKIIEEHRGSLTPQQMQGLRLAFDKLSPGYYRRTMLNRVQLRRLILLARLDPDSQMGKMLFINLMEATSQTVGLTYNNFMKTVLSFQYPAIF